MSGLPNPGDKQRIIDLERQLAQVRAEVNSLRQAVVANQGFFQQIRTAMIYDFPGEYTFAEYVPAAGGWIARSEDNQVQVSELPVGDEDALSVVFFDRGRWVRIPRGAPFVVGTLGSALSGASAVFTINESQWGAGGVTDITTLSNPLGFTASSGKKVICLMRDPVTVGGSIDPYVVIAVEP